MQHRCTSRLVLYEHKCVWACTVKMIPHPWRLTAAIAHARARILQAVYSHLILPTPAATGAERQKMTAVSPAGDNHQDKWNLGADQNVPMCILSSVDVAARTEMCADRGLVSFPDRRQSVAATGDKAHTQKRPKTMMLLRLLLLHSNVKS